ncbi:MAG: hypothetical protein CVV41_01610 [Candidatus Riflebacteria bacterium HGW-Riflebacteria-1]|nr:MAG: hypothetical protein CVV41_01610 [Candidatus Riflebacteria bacterium HGW-Riflebacteria-1]
MPRQICRGKQGEGNTKTPTSPLDSVDNLRRAIPDKRHENSQQRKTLSSAISGIFTYMLEKENT